MHPRLTHRTSWLDHHGELPVVDGTLIRLRVDRLPGDRNPKPVRLWSSRTGGTASDVDHHRRSYLRRFDLEHTSRLFKQTLGWTRPKIRTPQATNRWPWLVVACHTHLRPARTLAADLRRPPVLCMGSSSGAARVPHESKIFCDAYRMRTARWGTPTGQ
jgi:hypothetical protein